MRSATEAKETVGSTVTMEDYNRMVRERENAVVLTLQEIDNRITQLSELRSGLEAVFGLAPAVAPAAVAAEPRGGVKKTRVKAVAAGPVKLQGKGTRLEASKRNLEAGRRVAEPFGYQALADAAEITDNAAKSQITRWLGAGWIERVGRDQYQRTKRFGAGKKSEIGDLRSQREAEGKGTVPAGELQAELNVALRARDKARENGQEKLAAIHQAKVDQLEARLGGGN